MNDDERRQLLQDEVSRWDAYMREHKKAELNAHRHCLYGANRLKQAYDALEAFYEQKKEQQL